MDFVVAYDEMNVMFYTYMYESMQSWLTLNLFQHCCPTTVTAATYLF